MNTIQRPTNNESWRATNETLPPRQVLNRRGGCFVRLGRIVLAAGLSLLVVVSVFAAVYVLFPPPRTNILVMGIDARPQEGTATRTDVMILATVDPARPAVGMLSIPRDLWVTIPDYGTQRINAAHVLGEVENTGKGPALAVRTIEEVFEVDVQRYVRINFEGFVALIDAAGGITIDNPNYFIDYEYPTPDYGTMVVEFEEGELYLDGERALQYARSRHGSTDIARSKRQQQIISGLVRQMVSPPNWWRWPAVAAAFTKHVDTNLTVVDLVALGPAVLWVGPGGIEQRTFDETMVTGRVTDSGAQVQEPIWEGINPVLDAMFRR